MTHLHPDDVRERDGDFEIVKTFVAIYSGTCTMDNRHTVKRGTRVGEVRATDNPLIPISGVACAECVKVLPRAPHR